MLQLYSVHQLNCILLVIYYLMQESIQFTLLTVTFDSHVVCQLDVGQVASYLGFVAMGMSCSMLHSVQAS